MPRFIDSHTGETAEVTDKQATRLRPERFQILEVPDGSVAEVLEWAGDDPDRRTLALATERAGKQRKGIIDALS